MLCFGFQVKSTRLYLIENAASAVPKCAVYNSAEWFPNSFQDVLIVIWGHRKLRTIVEA